MKKIKGPDRRDGWYEIDPGTAQRLLDEQPPNRPLREAKAKRFSVPMATGKWKQNGEPIILDEKDRLLDGQGRCRGGVLAGKPFVTYVVHGIPRSMFPSLDIGQVRGGADTISCSVNGSSNVVLAASIARLAVACEKGSPTGKTVSNEEVLAFYRKNSERINRVISDLGKYFGICPLPPSALCYVYMEALEIDEEKAISWALGVATGEKLSSGSPILLLRNRMLKLKGEAHRLTPYEKLAFAIKSWNAYVSDRNLALLKWNARGTPSKQAEPFPQMLSADGE